MTVFRHDMAFARDHLDQLLDEALGPSGPTSVVLMTRDGRPRASIDSVSDASAYAGRATVDVEMAAEHLDALIDQMWDADVPAFLITRDGVLCARLWPTTPAYFEEIVVTSTLVGSVDLARGGPTISADEIRRLYGLPPDVPPRRLWLDDVRPQPDASWTWERTAPEAIELLSGHPIEEVSLDHDLGDEPDVGTGYDVACWIEREAFTGRLGRIAWTVHSANPVGRERMTAALRSAERFWRQAEVEDD